MHKSLCYSWLRRIHNGFLSINSKKPFSKETEKFFLNVRDEEVAKYTDISEEMREVISYAVNEIADMVELWKATPEKYFKSERKLSRYCKETLDKVESKIHKKYIMLNDNWIYAIEEYLSPERTSGYKFRITVSDITSREVFIRTCEKIESEFPHWTRKNMLIDGNGTTVQVFENENEEIVVYDDYGVGNVYILSDIQVELLCSLTEGEKYVCNAGR